MKNFISSRLVLHISYDNYVKMYLKGMGCAHMIDFSNMKHVSSVKRFDAGTRYAAGKKDSDASGSAHKAQTDVVQISADAVWKGKLSAFSTVLVREISDVSAERIATLKQQYAGDDCPVSGADIANAMVARMRVEGLGAAEEGSGHE